jgi:hypothetical protein
MTDAAASEVPAEPAPLVQPASDDTEAPSARVPAAGAPAEMPADAPALPEIEHPIGPTRQAVLDHMLDSEGDQSMAQIIAGVGNASRNTVETAVRREYESGRLLRISPGVYRLAPRNPNHQSLQHRLSLSQCAAMG